MDFFRLRSGTAVRAVSTFSSAQPPKIHGYSAKLASVGGGRLSRAFGPPNDKSVFEPKTGFFVISDTGREAAQRLAMTVFNRSLGCTRNDAEKQGRCDESHQMQEGFPLPNNQSSIRWSRSDSGCRRRSTWLLRRRPGRAGSRPRGTRRGCPLCRGSSRRPR